MNKSILSTIVAALFSIIAWAACAGSLLWVTVSFLIYLIKDIPFNWWSVWSVLISYSVVIIGYVGIALFAVKYANKEIKKKSDTKGIAFQTRLHEMQRKQKENLNNH